MNITRMTKQRVHIQRGSENRVSAGGYGKKLNSLDYIDKL